MNSELELLKEIKIDMIASFIPDLDTDDIEYQVIGDKYIDINYMDNTDIVSVDSSIDTSHSHYNNTSVRTSKIEYLIFHYTAGTRSVSGTAANICENVFKNGRASADFVVDDASICQYNPDIEHRYTYAVGGKKYPNSKGGKMYGKCKNSNSISIEMCSSILPGYDYNVPNHSGWYFTDNVLNNAVRIGKILKEKYNIPSENIIRHYDVNGKSCPGIVGWNAETGNESKWYDFKSRI